MASEPHWKKKQKKILSWWKIFEFFFQQKLRKSLFSLSLSFLLGKVGGEGEKKLEKEEKKKKTNSLF